MGDRTGVRHTASLLFTLPACLPRAKVDSAPRHVTVTGHVDVKKLDRMEEVMIAWGSCAVSVNTLFQRGVVSTDRVGPGAQPSRRLHPGLTCSQPCADRLPQADLSVEDKRLLRLTLPVRLIGNVRQQGWLAMARFVLRLAPLFRFTLSCLAYGGIFNAHRSICPP
jgi:hypothetical protein